MQGEEREARSVAPLTRHVLMRVAMGRMLPGQPSTSAFHLSTWKRVNRGERWREPRLSGMVPGGSGPGPA